MASSNSNPYRSALKVAIVAAIKSAGYTDTEPAALESLLEMAQSFIIQLAKSSKHYSELANRSQVMVSDVSLALVDSGVSLEEIKLFAEGHINKPSGVPPLSREHESNAPKPLSVSRSGSQPQYIHENLPVFPDKHTYIQTPAQRHPSTDYQLVREKAASQKKTAESALTKFIAKTGESNYYSDDVDNIINTVYPLIACKPSPLSYLSALLPKDENEYEIFDLKQEQDLPSASSKSKRLKFEPSVTNDKIVAADAANNSMEC